MQSGSAQSSIGASFYALHIIPRIEGLWMNIGINGFGRIGRNVLRAALESPDFGRDIHVVAINDIAPVDSLAYLLKWDTVYGKLGASPADGDTFTVDLKVFSKDGRTDGDPDRFEFGVTLGSIGVWQEEACELFGYGLHSDTAGGESVDEDFVYRCGDLLIP